MMLSNNGIPRARTEVRVFFTVARPGLPAKNLNVASEICFRPIWKDVVPQFGLRHFVAGYFLTRSGTHVGASVFDNLAKTHEIRPVSMDFALRKRLKRSRLQIQHSSTSPAQLYIAHFFYYLNSRLIK